MPTIAEIRQKYPQYDDMSDADLASALHQKFYSDMPREQFDAKVGLASVGEAEGAQPRYGRREAGSPLEEAARPITNYANNYNDVRREAQDQMSRGLEQLGSPTGGDLLGSVGATVGGLANLAGGAANYLISPAMGAFRSVVSQPLEDTAGLPREYTEFAGSLAAPLPKSLSIPPIGRAGRNAPTGEELLASYKAAKKSPEVAAAKIRPEASARNADIVSAELEKEWLDRAQAGKTHDILDRLQNIPKGPAPRFEMRGLESAGYTVPEAPQASVTMQNADSARRALGRLAGRQDEEGAAATIAKRKLDEWLGGLSQEDALAGNVPQAQEIMQGGRGDYAGMKAAEALDKKLATAERKPSARQVQTAMRTKVGQFLDGPDSRGLSTSQRAALESFARGTATQNTLDFVGRMLGGGGGWGTLMAGTMGHLVGGPAGAIGIPATGLGLSKISSMLTARQAANLSELIRSETPLGRQMQAAVAPFEKAAMEAQVSPTARNLSRLTIASRNLSNNLKDANINIAPNEILKSLFGQKPASADDE